MISVLKTITISALMFVAGALVAPYINPWITSLTPEEIMEIERGYTQQLLSITTSSYEEHKMRVRAEFEKEVLYDICSISEENKRYLKSSADTFMVKWETKNEELFKK